MKSYKGMKLFNLLRTRMNQRKVLLCLFLLSMSSCKKLVDIPEPVDTITTVKVFNNAENANTAVAGIYFKMNASAFNGKITIYPALSADELNVSAGVETFYQSNAIPSDEDKFWGSLYGVIYSANAVIEGLQASNSLSDKIKNQYTGEAKFVRSFCFFYLVNLFGDVPLATSIDFSSNSILSRAPVSKVYEQIVGDLEEAQSLLAEEYASSGGERIRANRAAATALLARVYLYMGKWKEAEENANLVIGNGQTYSLVGELTDVFKKNSKEAILQLQIGEIEPFATFEGTQFIPEYLTKDFPAETVSGNWQYFVPTYYLTNQLINAFEQGDQRRLVWLDSTGLLNGVNYYYPYKYKVRRGSAGNVTEYNSLLRLAEQYLIRAEARAKQGNLTGALNDLNAIRARAGLTNLPLSLNQTEVLSAVMHENQIEFCTEWGHRWFDLKRTGRVNAVIEALKGGNWQTTDQLYPIPKGELLLDPNLTQNNGYQ